MHRQDRPRIRPTTLVAALLTTLVLAAGPALRPVAPKQIRQPPSPDDGHRNSAPRIESHRSPEPMPSYMLLLHEEPDVFEKMSPEDFQRAIERHRAWSVGLEESGHHLASDKLTDGGT